MPIGDDLMASSMAAKIRTPLPLSFLRGSNSSKVCGSQIQWQMPGFFDDRHIAFSSIAIKDPTGGELNEDDAATLVEAAANDLIRSSKGGKPVLPGPLLTQVNKAAGEFFRQPKLARLLVTSISIDALPTDPIKVNGCKISNVSRSDYPYPSTLGYPSCVSEHLESSEYSHVAIETEQQTMNMAQHRSMDALNLVRAIWSLLATYQRSSWSLSAIPQRRWIGVIHLGPVQTIHNLDRSLNSDLYWHEPGYVEDARMYRPPKGWEDVESSRVKLQRLVEASPYKEELTGLLVRYVVALDQSNLDVAFLMIWSLLERITDTVGGRYEETIDRTVAIFNDPVGSRQLLNHMRMRRNLFVHSASTTSQVQQLCYLTKAFVDAHLMNLIRNRVGVKSVREYGDFLSLPHNTDRLLQLRNWCEMAYRMHSGKSAPPFASDSADDSAAAIN